MKFIPQHKHAHLTPQQLSTVQFGAGSCYG